MHYLIRWVFLALAAGLGCGSGTAAEPTILWSIGREDGSQAELALVDRFLDYAKVFPDDVQFTVGQSDPAQAWPAVQPGPQDTWAGSRAHPYTVNFQLDHVSEGSFVLRLSLVSTHGAVPGELVVEMNGDRRVYRLPRGPGDGALTNPAHGKAQRLDLPLDASLFQVGPNRLRLSTTGSWVIWDGLRLVNQAGGVGGAVLADSVRFKVLPLFIRRPDGLAQPASLSLTVVRPSSQLEARLRFADQSMELPIEVEVLGQVEERIMIPEITEPTEIQVELREGTEVLYEQRLEVRPGRRWTIHVVPQAHVDIGYTDLQERAMEVHRKSNDLAVELLERYPEFLWSVESSYVLEDWLETRSPEMIEEFFALARDHRLEIGAFYGNFLTGLLADEESFRSLYFSRKLSHEHGSSFCSATLTDAPSHIWSIPTILSKSGVKYLSMGINQTRAPLLRQGLDQRSPVWWEGPDGSRVLAFFHDHYAWAGRVGLTEAWGGQVDPDVGLAEAEDRIPWLLELYDRPDYPYDSIHLHGAYGDNQPLTEQLPRTVRAWNEKYAYPKIVFSSNEAWFADMERAYGNQLQTVSGDGGAFWEDGAASSALETAINRQNQQQALLAEMLLTGLHAQGRIEEDHRAALMDIWHRIMLYNEHTWGAHNSVAQPDLPEVREQFRYKAQFARDAQARLQPLLTQARDHLPEETTEPKATCRLDGTTLHTDHYLIEFDVKQGGIRSLVDRQTGREWVEQGGPHQLGQVIYARNDDPPYELSTATFRSLDVVDSEVVLQLHHPMMPEIQLVLRPHATDKRLDFEFVIEKLETLEKEGVYVAFPFAAKQPDIDYAVANAVVRAGRDWLPGACKDWFTVQNWVRVRDTGQDMVWVALDAPLISLQDINANRWLRDLPIQNGRVYAYVMNNYWFTNYKAAQGGRLHFRFALTSGGTIGNAQAARFGRDWTSTETDWVERLVSAAPDHVLVSGFKRAEDGRGYIVRLREMNGQPTQARLRVGALQQLRRAWLTSGVEDDLRELPVQNGRVPLELRPWDVVSVRVQ